ncbi:MAG: fused MFS/spermidine synthase, partial [Deltaproteobacteria bacterium]|nr:fused MFS/spermidine synthase [Deltaproteobacteria bacterium]
ALFLADFSDLGLPKWGVFSVHLVNFFMVSMVCHGEIARTRPAAGHLTVFYLWISVGGVLGGIFNSLVAPVVFPALFEYPVVLVLAALLVPAGRRARPAAIRLTWKEPALYLGTPLVLAPLVHHLTTDISVAHALHTFLIGLPFSWKTFSMIVNFGFPALACAGLLFLKRPLLFGIGFAAIFVTMTVQKDLELDIVHRQRNFFGVLTVSRSFDGSFMNLSHGTTLHGKQWLSPFHRREPASYYHRHGPAGEVFAEFDGTRKKKRIAVTGLGAGTLAAYAGTGQEIDFYEINPMVKRIATDAKYFTYLSDCRARWRIILGDARLTLAQAPSGRYGLVVLDAFSSDSIPVHLLTREAVALYLSKIEPSGVLLVHITNRYVDLAPVLARLAQEQGFACRLRDDEREFETGKDGSTWVVIARSERDLGGLARNGAWKKMAPRPGIGVWTDDFSNLLSVFKW